MHNQCLSPLVHRLSPTPFGWVRLPDPYIYPVGGVEKFGVLWVFVDMGRPVSSDVFGPQVSQRLGSRKSRRLVRRLGAGEEQWVTQGEEGKETEEGNVGNVYDTRNGPVEVRATVENHCRREGEVVHDHGCRETW